MKKGTINYSRRNSNFVKFLSPEEREQHIKHFIASCSVEQLIPFIEITQHDKNFREIQYVINVPEVNILPSEIKEAHHEKTTQESKPI